jgi:hypothetical protein
MHEQYRQDCGEKLSIIVRAVYAILDKEASIITEATIHKLTHEQTNYNKLSNEYVSRLERMSTDESREDLYAHRVIVDAVNTKINKFPNRTFSRPECREHACRLSFRDSRSHHWSFT